MKMSEMYPDTSTWLKAEDLQKRRVVVDISHVRAEEINDNDKGKVSKAVVYFKGKEKGLVLNKTNAAQIAYLYGDEMDMWADKQIELYPTRVDYAGKMVDAIRIAPPPGNAAPTPAAAPAGPEGGPATLDDMIPFAPYRGI